MHGAGLQASLLNVVRSTTRCRGRTDMTAGHQKTKNKNLHPQEMAAEQEAQRLSSHSGGSLL